MTENDNVYLEHILECAALIQDYTRGGKSGFMNDVLLQDATLRRLQTMTESTQRLSTDSKAKAPEVDWKAISGFRNVLVHDYLNGIDMEQVWDAIENYLPSLERAVQKLVDDTDEER